MTERLQTPEPPLESWKAIAAHLKRDVRTAKRWEQTEGLPVHRHLHQARASVYAYASELDAWWAARSPRLRAEAASTLPNRVASRLALAAALLATLATSRSSPPTVVRAAAQRTGPSLTEIFTAQLGMEIYPPARFSPDGKRLAATDNGYLVVVDAETENKTRLTTTNWYQPPFGFAENPAWSPDGARIAYAWWVNDRWELRVVPAAGGDSRVLYDKTSFFPSDWSPDGQQVLGWVDRPDGGASVATVSVGGELTELRTWDKTTRTTTSSAGMPMFSPDGRTVAYAKAVGERNQIFLLDVGTRAETALTGSSISDRLPVWSQDGRTLLFVSNRSGRADLWALPVRDGKPAGEARLAYADIGEVGSMCGWNGAGRLVFSRQVTSGELYTVKVDAASGATLGPPERPVSQLEGKHMRAVWSPDGKRLALLAQTRRQGALYAVTAGSSELRELNTHDLGWTHVAGWYPGGEALAVSATVNGPFAFYRVRVAGGTPELLYSDRQLTWSTAQLAPDGAAFVASGGSDATPVMRIVDLRRKQTIREVQLQPGQSSNAFVWTPDSRAIYAALGQRIVRIAVPSGEPEPIATVEGLSSLTLSPDGRTLALTRVVQAGDGGQADAQRRYQLFVVSASGGDLKRVQVPEGHSPWRVRWAAEGVVGYISWEPRRQFLRLSDFLPKIE